LSGEWLTSNLEKARKIDLMESEFGDLSSLLSKTRGATVCVLTADHEKWRPDIDPSMRDEEIGLLVIG
jgi:hypothetical protein